MLQHRTVAKIIPTWDSCIETLMNGHLPIKFAYTGRLSMHDVTQDGFYVLRHNTCPSVLYFIKSLRKKSKTNSQVSQ